LDDLEEMVEACCNKGDVIHAYLGYNIVSIGEKLRGIALLIKKMSGNRTNVSDSITYLLTELSPS
jgi:hypothetical protein